MKHSLKRIVESIFDDDDVDILNNTNDLDSGVYNKMSQKLLTGAADIIKNCKYTNDYIFSRKTPEDKKKIYAKVENEYCIFYYIEGDGTLRYVSHMYFESSDFNQALKFLDCLHDADIKYVLMTPIFECDYKLVKGRRNFYPTLDFHGIQFYWVTVRHVEPKNLYCNMNEIKQCDLFNEVSHMFSHMSTNGMHLEDCILEDNILLDSVNHITIKACKNIKDFSFIKHINSSIDITYYNSETCPKSGNLTGLPSGNYKVNVEYNFNSDEPYKDLDKVQNLVGFQSSWESLKVVLNVSPLKIFHHFSFEGLTMELLPKFKFIAYYFPGTHIAYNIQIGPYNILAKCRKWSPTKPQYETIIKTKNWFLDCYTDKPNKEYVPTEVVSDTEDKALKKIQKEALKQEQKTKDAKEDMDLMIKKVKSFIKPKDIFYSGWTMYINSMTDDIVEYNVIRRNFWNDKKYFHSYERFVKFIKNHHFRVAKETDAQLLTDIIVKPIEDRRERILKRREKEEQQRKEEEKLQKKLEKQKAKELEKEEKKRQREELKKQKELEKEEKKTKIISVDKPKRSKVKKTVSVEPVVQKKDSGITIMDYSDRAIVLTGNTYVIKDSLKELGFKFNKFLKDENGNRIAGWVGPKSKKDKAQELIDNIE